MSSFPTIQLEFIGLRIFLMTTHKLLGGKNRFPCKSLSMGTTTLPNLFYLCEGLEFQGISARSEITTWLKWAYCLPRPIPVIQNHFFCKHPCWFFIFWQQHICHLVYTSRICCIAVSSTTVVLDQKQRKPKELQQSRWLCHSQGHVRTHSRVVIS